jgi:hypothetical protein
LFVTITAVLAVLGGVPRNPGIAGLAALGAGVLAGGATTWLLQVHGALILKDRLGESGGLRLSRVLNYIILSIGLVYLVRPFIPDVVG